jgi:hypothetical protein
MLCTCGHSADDHAAGRCWHVMSDEYRLFDCQCEQFEAVAA